MPVLDRGHRRGDRRGEREDLGGGRRRRVARRRGRGDDGCIAAFTRSSRSLMIAWSDGVGEAGATAEAVVVTFGLASWCEMWQAGAGRAPGAARQSPEAARAVWSHRRPRRPTHPCDVVMEFDVLNGNPPGSRRSPIRGEPGPGVRSEPPIVAPNATSCGGRGGLEARLTGGIIEAPRSVKADLRASSPRESAPSASPLPPGEGPGVRVTASWVVPRGRPLRGPPDPPSPRARRGLAAEFAVIDRRAARAPSGHQGIAGDVAHPGPAQALVQAGGRRRR